MHIADGVLPLSVTLGGYLAAGLVAALKVRKVGQEELPKLAVVTSAFFVASLIHIPLGPTSVHLLLPGLAGVLLGSSAFLAIGLGLVLQSLLLQFGGLTVLGANTLMMGLPALACGWIFHRFKGTGRRRQVLLGGLLGGLGVVLAALGLALLLISGGEDFWGVAQIALLAHLPVIIIEGLITAMTVAFLSRVKPELLLAPQHFRSEPPHV